MKTVIRTLSTLVVLVLFISISGCSDDDAKDEVAEVVVLETVSEDLMPVLDGVTQVETSKEDGKIWAKYVSAEAKDIMRKKYEDFLKEKDWDIETIGTLGGKLVIGAQNEETRVDILISEEKTGSEIEITLSKN